ncbi:MAG TPA: CopG family transcriptional regulator [Terriglobia bacterium]
MPHTIRTSLDLPEDLHRRIHEAARRRGCSARALILSSIEREVAFEPGAKGRVRVPLITGGGEPVNPSPDEIYDVLFS